MTFQLPPEIGVEVPRPAILAAVLGTNLATSDGVDGLRIDELRALDEQLARYGDGVEAALDQATERLIARLAQEPAATLSGLPEPLSRG